MAIKRPTSVTVIAVLQIVFGSLGLLCGACAPISLVQQQNAPNEYRTQPKPGLTQAQREAFAKFAERSNENLPVAIGSIAVSLLGSILMLSGGIGMLGLKPWARTVMMAWGGLAIISQIGNFGYLAAVTYPQMTQFMADFKAGGPPSPVVDAMVIGMQAGVFAGVGVGVIALLYAIFVIYMLNRPEVVHAFATGGRPRPGDFDDAPEIDR